MSKPVLYPEFGRLLTEGTRQMAAARRESLQQTHQFLADKLGYSTNAIYVWRRGEHLPDNPDTVAELAKIFVEAWQADRQWVETFLAAGEYGPPQTAEKLCQELFGSAQLPADSLSRAESFQAYTKPNVPSSIQTPAQSPRRAGLFSFIERLRGRISRWIGGSQPANTAQQSQTDLTLFPSNCGDRGIDLADQRLLISSTFGEYFAGLLERKHNHIDLEGQVFIKSTMQPAGLSPLQNLYWLLHYPKGPRVLIIAAEGGMGKSTLAARLVRCLFEENVVDMILGDSAKSLYLDPTAGHVTRLEPGYYDSSSFVRQLCMQLGLPLEDSKSLYETVILQAIADRLVGRRAVIFVDNLETVTGGSHLLETIRRLASRDVRVIVTTRAVNNFAGHISEILVAQLNPLTEIKSARSFLEWHIQQYAAEHPNLTKLQPSLANQTVIQRLIERTGGIPLLMQLVLSDVARFSWQHLDHLPGLFGTELLDFLYQERWRELGTLGEVGQGAKALLRYVGAEQFRGQQITYVQLNAWANKQDFLSSPQPALKLLQERFLIVNRDLSQGHFAIFPSLAEFLQRQDS